MNKKTSDKIVNILTKLYADASPDLNFTGLYQLLISVTLSARTTDRQVNSVTGELFSRYSDFEKLAKAGLEDVERIIRPVGFYKTKAANIINLSRIVTEKFNGNVPQTMEELTTLPGVGRKTSNVVLSVGFGKPAFAVDTHVTRISNRLGYIDSADPLEVEKAVTALVNEDQWGALHLSMIKHGRTVCRAAKPACSICGLRALCRHYRNSV
jgi:endonuclease-3